MIEYNTGQMCDMSGDFLTFFLDIADTVDVDEAKCVFATHYSQIYHLVYEGVVSAESKIRGPG